MMGGVASWELIHQYRDEEKGNWKKEESKKDWLDLCLEIEHRYPATPDSSFWPKKYRRFQSPNQARGRKARVKLCSEIDQDLFHVKNVMVEERDKYKLEGLVVIMSLEELIQIMTEKKMSPRLLERKIRVTGRRMERFIPPRWRPKAGNRFDRRLEEIKLQKLEQD
jgi:hypothetical protein